jgi:hypothetical protein
MARLTYKIGSKDSVANGPAALGKLFVSYWENVRDKDENEIANLTASLKTDIAKLFEETESGEVDIQLVKDTDTIVHIPVPVPSNDLSKYKNAGFAEAFGHAIIMACGRSPKLQLERTESSAVKLQPVSDRTDKAA